MQRRTRRTDRTGRTGIAALALGLSALGCTTTWLRADGSDFYEKQLAADMEACRTHIGTRADLTRPFADCMRQRGWVAADESDPEG